MKKIFLPAALVVINQIAFSQLENSAMADEFKEISKFGTRQSGFEGIQTYSSGIVNGSAFFSPEWSEGSVTTIFNETFGKNYSFLFDKVRQELFMKWKDSAVVLLADKNQIRSFTLNTDKVHTFVASAVYDSAAKGNFLEVLVSSEKGYALLKFVKSRFVTGDIRDIEKQRLGEIYDSFVDAFTYYISFNNGTLQKVALKEKSMMNVLSAKKNRAADYFAAHRGEQKDEIFYKGLVEYINQ